MCCRNKRQGDRHQPLIYVAASKIFQSIQARHAAKQLALAATGQSMTPESGNVQGPSFGARDLSGAPPAYEALPVADEKFVKPTVPVAMLPAEKPYGIVLSGKRAERMQRAEEKAYVKLQRKAEKYARRQ